MLDHMDINTFFQSKTFKGVLWGVGGCIIILLIFKLGVAIGLHKADFSCRWNENYQQNFLPGRPTDKPQAGLPGMMQPMLDFADDRKFLEANTVLGQIISINDSVIVVKDRDDIEKSVLATDQTLIKLFRDTIQLSNLKANDSIMVFGEPNDQGQVVAKLIRLLPEVPTDQNVPPQAPSQ